MTTAWIFIEKDKTGGIQRTEIYGSFTRMYNSEMGLRHLAPSEQTLRTVIKYKYVSNLFHIEKKNVKRSKHRK